MVKPLVLGFVAFLVTGGGIAIAQDMAPPPPGARAMARADANGDGVITRQEVIDEAAQRFDRMDLNHDGKLDQGEMQAAGQRMRGMRGMRGMGGDMPPPPPPAPAPPRQ